MDAKEQYILTKKIKLLHLNSLIPAILSSVIGLSLAATLWRSINHQSLLIWLSITLLMSVIRISQFFYFKKCQPTGQQLLKWETPYAISLFAALLNWGVGLLLIVPNSSLTVIIITSIFTVSLAIGAMSWYGQIRYMQISAVCLLLIPTIIALLTRSEYEAFWLGITACFMFFGCTLTCVLLQKTLNDHYVLSYELEKSIKKAKMLAHTDVLTGLNNRRAFFKMAPKMLTKCQHDKLPLCLITFDVDYFKKINDAFGHAAGDLALQQIASLLIKNLRSSDICCRLGGEEFAILLPNIDLEKAIHIAENFRTAMMVMPIKLSYQKSITITASFGVSDVGSSIDEMLSHADQAMYKAKNSGRNVVVAFVPELNTVSTQAKTRKSLRA